MTHSTKGHLILKSVEPEREESVIDYLAGLFKNASREQVTRLVGKAPVPLVKNIPESKAVQIIAALGRVGADVEFRANPADTLTPSRPEAALSPGTDEPAPEPERTRTDHAKCSQCGRSHSREEMLQYKDAWICADCKAAFVQKLKEGEYVGSNLVFGGFWLRAGAKIIDGIVLTVVGWVLGFILNILAGTADSSGAREIASILASILNIAVGVAYVTWFIGKFAATPGKMACGLSVVMPDGARVSYARALGRYFAEWISSMILGIGYLMAAFDDEKRTLHDRICTTRVVKKQS